MDLVAPTLQSALVVGQPGSPPAGRFIELCRLVRTPTRGFPEGPGIIQLAASFPRRGRFERLRAVQPLVAWTPVGGLEILELYVVRVAPKTNRRCRHEGAILAPELQVERLGTCQSLRSVVERL